MKKISTLLALLLIITVSCKKLEKTPEGPTDIRIRNLSDQQMTDLKVNTSGGEFVFGDVTAGSVTDYHRFDKAYPKANITAVINGQVYRTDSVKPSDYLYYQYLGPIKATYEIFIENASLKKLKISNVIPESDLK